jgi:hypothetical protein
MPSNELEVSPVRDWFLLVWFKVSWTEAIAVVGRKYQAPTAPFAMHWPGQVGQARCVEANRKRFRRPGIHHRDAALCRASQMRWRTANGHKDGLIHERSRPPFPRAQVSPLVPTSKISSHPPKSKRRAVVIPRHTPGCFANGVAAHPEQTGPVPEKFARRIHPRESPIAPKHSNVKRRSGNQDTSRFPALEMQKPVARALHDKSRANVKTRDIRGVLEQTLGSGHEPACFGRTTDV